MLLIFSDPKSERTSYLVYIGPLVKYYCSFPLEHVLARLEGEEREDRRESCCYHLTGGCQQR